MQSLFLDRHRDDCEQCGAQRPGKDEPATVQQDSLTDRCDSESERPQQRGQITSVRACEREGRKRGVQGAGRDQHDAVAVDSGEAIGDENE